MLFHFKVQIIDILMYFGSRARARIRSADLPPEMYARNTRVSFNPTKRPISSCFTSPNLLAQVNTHNENRNNADGGDSQQGWKKKFRWLNGIEASQQLDTALHKTYYLLVSAGPVFTIYRGCQPHHRPSATASLSSSSHTAELIHFSFTHFFYSLKSHSAVEGIGGTLECFPLRRHDNGGLVCFPLPFLKHSTDPNCLRPLVALLRQRKIHYAFIRIS